MKAIVYFLKLIRLPNLLIIALTQYAMRYLVIDAQLHQINEKINSYLPGFLHSEFLTLQMSDFHFFLLSLSTVMIAAAGYIINDYFDLKIDRVNKPEKIIIIRHIKRRVAMGAHIVINTLAVLIGLYLCYTLGLLKHSLIFILVPALLWYYSVKFKRQIFIGNFVISFFTALIPIVVLLFELPLIDRKYSIIHQQIANYFIDVTDIYHYISNMVYFVIAFAFFAFLVNLVREIIKDIEDIEGDRAYHCRTIPVVFGITKAKYVAMALLLIMVLSMAYILSGMWGIQDHISFYYILCLLIIPSLFLAYRIFKAEEKKDFHFASTFLKIIMLLGICYSGVIYYNFVLNV